MHVSDPRNANNITLLIHIHVVITMYFIKSEYGRQYCTFRNDISLVIIRYCRIFQGGRDTIKRDNDDGKGVPNLIWTRRSSAPVSQWKAWMWRVSPNWTLWSCVSFCLSFFVSPRFSSPHVHAKINKIDSIRRDCNFFPYMMKHAKVWYEKHPFDLWHFWTLINKVMWVEKQTADTS